jgi:hypothetical protein
MRRASSIIGFPEPGEWWKILFRILSQKFQIYQRTLRSLPENADNIIFASCILHNYLRDQGVGVSDMGSSADVGIHKYQAKEEVPTKVIGKFKQLFNSPPGSVPWQNERVQCQVNL